MAETESWRRPAALRLADAGPVSEQAAPDARGRSVHRRRLLARRLSAAGFPELAKRNGTTLVIVNHEPTGLDPIADLVLNRAIGETLGAAVGID